eukprot:snap_masked-scaffold_16-processed-gene-6.84-mRNA-1 protein AED:1.00 eAED:1.00 QI:0/0/0/0/1/1/3/0/677
MVKKGKKKGKSKKQREEDERLLKEEAERLRIEEELEKQKLKDLEERERKDAELRSLNERFDNEVDSLKKFHLNIYEKMETDARNILAETINVNIESLPALNAYLNEVQEVELLKRLNAESFKDWFSLLKKNEKIIKNIITLERQNSNTKAENMMLSSEIKEVVSSLTNVSLNALRNVAERHLKKIVDNFKPENKKSEQSEQLLCYENEQKDIKIGLFVRLIRNGKRSLRTKKIVFKDLEVTIEVPKEVNLDENAILFVQFNSDVRLGSLEKIGEKMKDENVEQFYSSYLVQTIQIPEPSVKSFNWVMSFGKHKNSRSENQIKEEIMSAEKVKIASKMMDGVVTAFSSLKEEIKGSLDSFSKKNASTKETQESTETTKNTEIAQQNFNFKVGRVSRLEDFKVFSREELAVQIDEKEKEILVAPSAREDINHEVNDDESQNEDSNNTFTSRSVQSKQLQIITQKYKVITFQAFLCPHSISTITQPRKQFYPVREINIYNTETEVEFVLSASELQIVIIYNLEEKGWLLRSCCSIQEEQENYITNLKLARNLPSLLNNMETYGLNIWTAQIISFEKETILYDICELLGKLKVGYIFNLTSQDNSKYKVNILRSDESNGKAISATLCMESQLKRGYAWAKEGGELVGSLLELSPTSFFNKIPKLDIKLSVFDFFVNICILK